jgi:hypothetical protein
MQKTSQFNYAPPAPTLVPHGVPFPGMTPVESAQSGLSMSGEFADVIAATFFSQGGAVQTQQQVKHNLPADWVGLLGKFAHASLSASQAEKRGIECIHVWHDGGGFHFEYRIKS